MFSAASAVRQCVAIYPTSVGFSDTSDVMNRTML